MTAFAWSPRPQAAIRRRIEADVLRGESGAVEYRMHGVQQAAVRRVRQAQELAEGAGDRSAVATQRARYAVTRDLCATCSAGIVVVDTIHGCLAHLQPATAACQRLCHTRAC